MTALLQYLDPYTNFIPTGYKQSNQITSYTVSYCIPVNVIYTWNHSKEE